MRELLLNTSLFAVMLTLGAFEIGLWAQKKLRHPLVNPLLIAVILVIGTIVLLDYPVSAYQDGVRGISWLLTPCARQATCH